MRIAVITCQQYADAWDAFLALFRKFWPDCPYAVTFYSDRPGEMWCSVVMRCAKESHDPVMLFLEDYFLSVPVQSQLIERGLQVFQNHGASCLRLYPSPGASVDFGDPHYGMIPKGAPYRISSQVAIWDPEYLYDIARCCRNQTTGEARDFETQGTEYSNTIAGSVLAFKREVKPWPLEYLSSAINRGKWNLDAKRLCTRYGIAVDWSRRPMDEDAA